MRALFEITALQNIERLSFERKFRSVLRSLIYNNITYSPYLEHANLHDSNKPALFCFSNISGKFGEKGIIQENQKYSFIISTPLPKLFFSIVNGFKKRIIMDKNINLGVGQFELNTIKSPIIKLNPGDTLISDNIIVLTKKTGKKKKFLHFDDENYLTAISHNINTKVNAANIVTNDLLGSLNISKISDYSVKFAIKPDFDYFVSGTKLQLKIRNEISPSNLHALEYIFDTGLGDYCSYGFGFLKKVKNVA